MLEFPAWSQNVLRRGPRSLVLGAALAGVLLTSGIYAYRAFRPERPIRYIAYIGRYVNANFDAMHEAILEYYLSAFRAEHHEVDLRLKTISIGGESSGSIHAYTADVLSDPSIIAVIDNTWGKDLQAAAAIIREGSVPVISINADHRNIDYGRHVLFIGHADVVPRYIASFTEQVLEKRPDVLVNEADYGLSERFLQELEGVGLSPQITSWVPSEEIEAEAWAELETQLDRSLADPDREKLVLLNTHSNWGNYLIRYIDDHYLNTTILAGYYATSSARGIFGLDESGFPNHHRNHLILFTQSSDMLSEKLFTDIKNLERAFPRYLDSSNFNVPLFVKRCSTAVSIIDWLIQQAHSKSAQGGLARDALTQGLRSLARRRALATKDEVFDFDSDLRLFMQSEFEIFEDGDSRSHPYQVNSSFRRIPNIRFGIEILDVNEISPQHGTFHADFYYWIQSTREAADLQESLHFRNLRQGEERLIIEDPENNFRLLRVSGDFQAQYGLEDFPLDQQNLALQLELVHDTEEARASFDRKGFEEAQSRAEDFRIKAWEILDDYATVDNYVAASLHKEAQGPLGSPQKFQSLNVRLHVRRRPLEPFVTFILPLAMIGFAAVAVSQLRDVSFKSIGEVSVVIFLSIVTYSVAFAEFKPEAGVLTKADLLFYATFLTVLLIFLTVILVSSIHGSSILDKHQGKIIRYAGRLIGLGYLACLLAIPLMR